jgi:hypothetical protein
MSGKNGELRRRYCLGTISYNFVIPSFKHGLSQNTSIKSVHYFRIIAT